MLPMLRTPQLIPTSAEPWSELRREVDRLFDTMLSGRPLQHEGGTTWLPTMDVEETERVIRLALEVPGVDTKDLSIEVENNALIISGERREERNEGEERGARLVERRYGRFERRIALPEHADAEHATAHYDHGVLTIEVPKGAASKRRRIQIGSGGREERQQQLGTDEAPAGGRERGSSTTRSDDRREQQVA